ncbi:hypothetical protein A9Q99_22825 [Gammaproteobacteria bacterium 45_16_T64]|nr:hypothetical protein A9Q99_22825 [Gammaproteobacteria bacterium 45_16_T64]
MGITSLFDNLAKHLNLPNLRLNEYGVCKLNIEDSTQLFMEVEESNRYLYLYACIGDIPTYDKAPFYEELLQRNCFGASTGDTSLCCDKDKNEVVLFQNLYLKLMDQELFNDVVDEFIHQVRVQRQWLSQIKLTSTQKDVILNVNEPNDFMLRV